MASKTLNCIFVHGVGKQKSDFAHDARRYLRSALKSRGIEMYARSVHWAPILDDGEKKMLESVGKLGSSNRMSQRLVVETLADALCYQHKQETIQYLVDYELSQFNNQADEVVVFAHSLGVLLMSDYLRNRPKVKIQKFVSFGTNLQLFNIGRESAFVCPEQLKGVGRWTNYWDEDDMLGWPVSGWLPHVKDTEVSVGPWWSGWTGLSHIGYFEDKDLWSKKIPNDLFPGVKK